MMMVLTGLSALFTHSSAYKIPEYLKVGVDPELRTIFIDHLRRALAVLFLPFGGVSVR